MTAQHSALPLDERSRDALAAEGLRYALVDGQDAALFDAWLQADQRGFHAEALTEEQLAEHREGLAFARSIGVWDPSSADPATPVGTVGSWRSSLSLGAGHEGASAGASIEGWAISAVTVAPTHRRRGIARALLEGELRAASNAGIPLAMLTVSEATIYGRWGFGPATWAADYSVDTRALQWTGPRPTGRVHQVSPASLRALAPQLAERAHRRESGEVPGWEHYWQRMLGLTAGSTRASKLRAARYDDEQGNPQGFALYSLAADPDDYTAHTVSLDYLCAANDDAHAELWRFVLELDLVATVRAPLRPVDEPVQWMVSNPRAVRTSARSEHLWLRILDLPASLTARRYAHADTVLLRVDDRQGFAHGDWMLTTSPDGAATVTPADADPAPEAAVVRLGVDVLGTLLLGGAPVESLRAAARLVEERPGSAARLDALFRTTRAPHLSIWF